MKTAAPASIVPHPAKVKLVEQMVKPESLRAEKTAWGRELKILGALIAQYPDPEFWAGFSLGFMVNSLAFLKTDKGATMLGDAYRLYTYHKTQPQISLDTVNKPNTFVEDITDAPAVKPKRDALSWADSTTTNL